MRSLASKPNTVAPGGDYPYGAIKDNPGNNTGTPVNEQVYGDIHQFFEQIMEDAGLVANDLPENTPNGFQLNDALATIIKDISLPMIRVAITGAMTFDSYILPGLYFMNAATEGGQTISGFFFNLPFAGTSIAQLVLQKRVSDTTGSVKLRIWNGSAWGAYITIVPAT